MRFRASRGPREFGDSTEECHPIYGALDVPGDLTFSCNSHLVNFLQTNFLCFFSISYNAFKGDMQDGDLTKPLGPALHMLAAAEAGVATLVLTNPIWVIKTRLCLQYGGPEASLLSEDKRYR